MKKIIILAIAFSFYTLDSSAQTVNDVPFDQIDVEYVQIVGTSKLLSNKVTIEIDFGQENKFWSNKSTQLKDQSGRKVEFNSMIDALNFMSDNGYNFETAYALTMGNQNVYHFMLKRDREFKY